MTELVYSQENKTKKYFYKIAVICYICGFPNFWFEDLEMSKSFIKIYDKITKFLNAILYVFLLLELAAFLTQDKLTYKQKSYLMVYGLSHPILFGYRIAISRHQPQLTEALLEMIVRFKRVYNDPVVEKQMIRKSFSYSFALILNCIISMIMYTSDALLQVTRKGATFNVLITAWPDVEDTSPIADTARIVFFVFWLIFMSRVLAAYLLVICVSTCLSHQYKQLQSYFYSLNDIFDKENVSQRMKEKSYEESFKIGVDLHLDTLRCTRQCDVVCRIVFSGQIVFNVVLIAVLLSQMVNSERTLVNTCATAATAWAVLISTGFFMWNSGDVTVEASQLSTAMYSSGWQNCQGEAGLRVRKLLTTTMTIAQKTVVLKGLYIIDLSYQSYLSIVKSSYSVFSLLY